MEYPIPHFTLWTILLLLAAGQGIFFFFLLMSNKKQRENGGYFIGGLVLVFALSLLDYIGYWTDAHHLFPHLASNYIWLTFLVGPLFLGYIFQQNGIKISWIHFLPALVILILQLPFFAAPTPMKLEVLNMRHPYPNLLHFSPQWWYPFINNLTLLHLLLYVALTHLNLRKPTNQAISNSFQQTLYLLYIGYVASFLVYFIMVITPYYILVLDYSIALTMAFCIYSIAFLVYRKPQIFENQSIKAVFQVNKYKNSTLTPNAIASIKGQLEEYMQKHTPYYNSDLRLPALAEALNVSSHHLSQVINEQYNQSFTSYINTYRIEKAKELLTDTNLQVTEIAYQVGFNNKTSFYKAFKSKTALSPSAFRKQYQQLGPQIRQHL